MVSESEIRSWIGGQTRNWDQQCQALMWQLANRFGTVRSTPPSAIEAYRMEAAAGRIQSGTPAPGGFTYYEIGTFGHVGFMMNGGRDFMGTSRLVESWTNSNAGWNTISGYTAATGARYLGWSWQNGGNTVPFSADGSDTAGGDDLRPIELEVDDMIRISAVNRGVAVIGAGYYRQLNTDEEVTQAEPIVTKTLEGNDRQFDLWVSIALAGRGATSDGTAEILAEIAARTN